MSALVDQPALVGLLLGAIAVMLVLTLRREPAAVLACTLSLGLTLAVPFAHIPDQGLVRFSALGGAGLVGLVLLRMQPLRRVHAVLLLAVCLGAFAPATMLAGAWFELRILAMVACVTLPLAALVAQLDDTYRLHALRGFTLVAGFEAAYSYLEFFLHRPPLWFSFATRDDFAGVGTFVQNYNSLLGGAGTIRAQGTLVHPLLLAFVSSLALIAVCLAPVVQGRIWRAALVLGFAGVILISGSRTFLVVVPVVLLFFWTRRRGMTVGRLLGGAYLAAIIVGALWFLGFFETAAVRQLLGSESYTHRAGVMGSSTDLLANSSVSELLGGSGYLSVDEVYASGRLVSPDGLRVIDNMFVSALAMGGMLSLAALIWLLWVSARRASTVGLALLMCSVGTFLSFDVLMWPASAAMVAFVIGYCASEDRHLGRSAPNQNGVSATSVAKPAPQSWNASPSSKSPTAAPWSRRGSRSSSR